MVELAIHQKPLHQVDMLLAGGAGAAERAGLDRGTRRHACLRRLPRLVQVTGDVVRKGGIREETPREEGKMENDGGGGHQTCQA